MCSQKQRCKKDLRKRGQRFRERGKEERLSTDLECQNFGPHMMDTTRLCRVSNLKDQGDFTTAGSKQFEKR